MLHILQPLSSNPQQPRYVENLKDIHKAEKKIYHYKESHWTLEMFPKICLELGNYKIFFFSWKWMQKAFSFLLRQKDNFSGYFSWLKPLICDTVCISRDYVYILEYLQSYQLCGTAFIYLYKSMYSSIPHSRKTELIDDKTGPSVIKSWPWYIILFYVLRYL